jgi:hypothetical protein
VPKQPEDKNLSVEDLITLIIMNAPVPIRRLFRLYAKRSTFASWKKQGLEIRNLDGLGPCVIPSEFTAFLMKKWGDAGPRIH